jgi:lipoprotein-releasing system permease protein
VRWWPTALERHIALRYLRGQRGTRTASLQTVIAIGSIMLGVSALIVVLAVMNGLSDDLRDRILVGSPHLRVLTFGPTLRVEDWRHQIAVIDRDSEVVVAAPEVSAQALMLNESGYPEGVFVSAFGAVKGPRAVVRMDTVMTEGNLDFAATKPEARGGVVIGTGLRDHLSVNVGDLVYMYSPTSLKPSRVTGMVNPQKWPMQVTGVFQTGMYIYDNQYVMMDLATAQTFAGLDTAVSDIAVRLRDAWRAPAVATRLNLLLGYPYHPETWQEKNQTLFSALRLEKLAMGLVIFFVMIVAAFNIVGTLTMVVAFKTREIGILQAMGLSGRGVARVFLAQGAIMGVVGTTLGLILGLATALVVNKRIHIDPTVYFIDRLPVHVEVFDVAVVVLASIAVAVLATLPSTRRASRLQPVEAIRAE